MTLKVILPPSLGRPKAAARAELIETALRRDLDEPVSASVAASYAELEDQVLGARVDLAWAPVAVCVKLGPVRAIFTIVRDGRKSYRSALVARRSDARSLATLAGARAAWVDPLSAGGYLLAVGLLRAQGIDPDRTFASQMFAGSHRAAIEAVIDEIADVAAVSAHATDEDSTSALMRWYAGPAGDRLTAIAFTEPCLNDAFVITTRLSEAEAERVAARLVPTGQRARTSKNRILPALEAEGLERADVEDYRRLRPLLWPEGSLVATVRTPSRRPPPR